jgi:N-acetylneuraminate lyase
MRHFSGIWPALITPFTQDKQVDTAALGRIVEYQVALGVDGFYICGNTGLGLFLSLAERKLVLETVLQLTKGRASVIAQVGALALSDAIELARHAQAQGADGISSIIPPLYPTLESTAAYFETLAAAVPDLPFFIYVLNPTLDTMALAQRLLSLPNLRGAKYSGPNMYEFRQIVELRRDDWSIFAGMDEQSALAALSGSCGHIGSTLNYMPHIYRQMRALVLAGDFAGALRLQDEANRITTILLQTGQFIGALYETMRLLGFDCGQPRLPYRPLDAAAGQKLAQALAEADFWSLVQRP